MVATVWGNGTPNEAFEIPPASVISSQTGNYLVLAEDAHRVIDYTGTGGHTFTLPSTALVGNGFLIYIRHLGSGAFTVAANAGDTVSAAASMPLIPAQAVALVVKGTSFTVLSSAGFGNTAADTSLVPVGAVAATNVQAAIAELDAEKAVVAGNTATTFNVAPATEATHAIRKEQVEATFVTKQQLIDQAHTAFTTAGTGLAYTLTPDIPQLSYVEGSSWSVKFHADSAPANQTSGTLIIGRRYTIAVFNAGDNFMNAGAASNAVGVTFIAVDTGGGTSIPATWTNASSLQLCPTINISGLGAKNLIYYSDMGEKRAVFAGAITATNRYAISCAGVAPNDEFIVDVTNSSSIPGRSQVFAASGIWVKPVGLPAHAVVEVELWGGGGSGGCSTSGYEGGGGGGGAYNCRRFLASQLAATEQVTVAAPMAGGGNGAGGSGNFSSFGVAATLVTAAGGGGGSGSGSLGGGGGGARTAGAGQTAGLGFSAGDGGIIGGGIANITTMWGGGSGGNGATGLGFAVAGGRSLFGGAGGAGANQANTSTAGGDSLYGGDGGSSTAGAPAPGIAPGGGGSGSSLGGGVGGAGARGEVRVWVLA